MHWNDSQRCRVRSLSPPYPTWERCWLWFRAVRSPGATARTSKTTKNSFISPATSAASLNQVSLPRALPRRKKGTAAQCTWKSDRANSCPSAKFAGTTCESSSSSLTTEVRMDRTAEYDFYILSPQWGKLKDTHPDPQFCAYCTRDRNLHMHHMRYPANIWDTKHEDCCWLCERCHDCFHRGLIAGRAQGYVLDGTSKGFTLAVIKVQYARESYVPAAKIFEGLTVEQVVQRLSR